MSVCGLTCGVLDVFAMFDRDHTTSQLLQRGASKSMQTAVFYDPQHDRCGTLWVYLTTE
jgi:hypothetical protein